MLVCFVANVTYESFAETLTSGFFTFLSRFVSHIGGGSLWLSLLGGGLLWVSIMGGWVLTGVGREVALGFDHYRGSQQWGGHSGFRPLQGGCSVCRPWEGGRSGLQPWEGGCSGFHPWEGGFRPQEWAGSLLTKLLHYTSNPNSQGNLV